MRQYSGIHAVLYALFDASGRLDRGAMRAQVSQMLELGVDGITVLGLATEVHKLSAPEQCDLVSWTAEDLNGRLPFSVTISGNDVQTQRDLVKSALADRADWLILQPPMAGAYPGDTYLDFFLRVADGFDAAFAVQHAPAYLGRSLGLADIDRLIAANPNFSLLKAETSAVELAETVKRCGRRITVLNGRGGLELTDCLRAGASGFVLAPDVIDFSKAAFDAWTAGSEEQAEAIYRDALPAITFMMQSVEHLICYGKRIYGLRTGTAVHDRPPALAPTDFGARLASHWAQALGPLGGAHDFGA